MADDVLRSLIARAFRLRVQIRGLAAAIPCAVALWVIAWWQTPSKIATVSLGLGAVVVAALALVRDMARELDDVFRAIRTHTR